MKVANWIFWGKHFFQMDKIWANCGGVRDAFLEATHHPFNSAFPSAGFLIIFERLKFKSHKCFRSKIVYAKAPFCWTAMRARLLDFATSRSKFGWRMGFSTTKSKSTLWRKFFTPQNSTSSTTKCEKSTKCWVVVEKSSKIHKHRNGLFSEGKFRGGRRTSDFSAIHSMKSECSSDDDVNSTKFEDVNFYLHWKVVFLQYPFHLCGLLPQRWKKILEFSYVLLRILENSFRLQCF